MKIAYIFSTQGHTVSFKLGKMILPQLERDAHGVEVVGMRPKYQKLQFIRKGNVWYRQGARSVKQVL